MSPTTGYTYNSNGSLATSTTNGVTTTYSTDSAGNVASVTDANNHTTSFTYQWGTLKNTETPLYTIARTINPTGTVDSVTQNGQTSQFSYDYGDRLTLVQSPGRTNRSITYNSDSIVTAEGSASSTSYIDGFARTTSSTNSAGLSTATVYDAQGRATRQDYPTNGIASGYDTYGYDDEGRLTSISHSAGGTAYIVYSPYNRNITTVDENGHSTTEYRGVTGDGSMRVTTTIDAASTSWGYGYNGTGSLVGVYQPTGGYRLFTYDINGRVATEMQPESGTTAYGYDGVGLLTTKQDARGTVLNYAYDANNRLVGITGGDAPVTIGYDNANNRTSISNGTVSTIFGYDAANRLTSRTDTIAGHAYTTSYAYDGRDNLTTVTYPSGRHVYYAYDNGNRITGVTGDSGAVYAAGLSYHPSGAIAGLTFGNGTTETTTFDGHYRPSHRQSGPSNDRLDLTYGYDNVGNVTSITDPRSGRSSSFTYDALDRLSTISGFGANAFTYDELGNRQSESATGLISGYANLRLAWVTDGTNTTSYGYDGVGNLIADGTNRTYEYTAFNQLKAAHVNGAETHYGYDGDGARVMKTGANGITYTLGGLAEYEDTGGVPQLVREYVYLGGRLLASIGRPDVPTSIASVVLVQPGAGATFAEGDPIFLRATPTVTNGSVASIAFYDNGIKVGETTSAPWAVTLPLLPAGTHQLLARLVTSIGAVASSAVTTVTVSAAACQTIRAKVDFDGDGVSDPALFCPAAGGASIWKYLASGNGNTLTTLILGSTGDIPVPGDYDGDGKTDPAVYRPSTGVWYLAASTSGYTPTTYSWGGYLDCTPLAEDFDGDGKADPTCYRPNGDWDAVLSTWISTYGYYGWLNIGAWGGGDMVPVVADFDGDGRADLTVFQGSTGAWYIAYSSTGYQTASGYYWGGPGDVPMGGDYDGYGPSLTIYRPSTGTWYALPHWTQFNPVFWWAFQWTASGDIPISGDFDGDGRMDWYVRHGDHWQALLTSGWWTSARDVIWPANDLAPPPEPPEPPEPAEPGFETGPPVVAQMHQAATTAVVTTPALPDAERDAAPNEDAISAPSAEVTTFDPSMTVVTMTVDINGAGTGSVTASGFSCSGALTTCTGSFTSGTGVTFSASGLNGSTFVGWSGACSGTSSTCTVTATDGLLAIATFAPAFSTTLYYHVDVLGSVRAISNSAGQTVDRHDYVPFGADVTTLPGAGNDAHRFAGVERDSTGLDSMGARSYNMFQGRFTGVDPVISGAVGDPQKWNRYAYARNNPLRFVDPTGLSEQETGQSMACQKGLSTFCGLVVVNTNAHLNGACFDPSCRAGGVAASDLDLDAWADALEADPTWYGNTPQQPKPPKIDPKTVIAALPEGTLAAVKEAIIQAEAPTEYSAGGHRESSFEILRSSTDGSTGFGTFVPGQWQAADGTPYRYARELDKTPNGQFDQMLLDLHVHGSAFTRAAGYVMGPSPADPLDPRDGDIPNANGIYNIVVSMADRRVYFYSQNPSQTTSITLQAFLNGLK